MSDEPIFFTPLEVANKLRVSKMTISRMIKSGEMPAFKIGGQYRISSEKLKTYMEAVDTTAKFDQSSQSPLGITFGGARTKDEQPD